MQLKLHHLHLERSLTVLNCETTGVDPHVDCIVEIAAIKITPAARPEVFHTLVHPGRPIPMAATAIHGIGASEVSRKPRFREIAQDLHCFLNGSDRAGFNLPFDLAMLQAEFDRVRLPFRLRGRCLIDVLSIYRKKEPRDLASAVAHYLGRPHHGADGARTDALAALEVLDQQVAVYDDLPRTPAELHAVLVEVDVARRFRRGEGGAVVFNFGKHNGVALKEVAESDPGYLEWVLRECRLLKDAEALLRQALAGKPLEAP